MNDLLQIGRIVGVHGVQGELTVYPLTDDPKRFSSLKDCFLVKEGNASPVGAQAVHARYTNDRVLLKLKGITDREQALALKGKYIAVTRDNAVKLAPDTYFISDLIGCRVTDDESGELGVMADVMQTGGANDIYVIKRENKKDLLIPAIKGVVHEIDVEARIIRVHLLDGLLDL